MKNKLSDLRNHLFMALEALSEAKGDELESAVKRADAMSGVAKVLVDSARVEIEYIRHVGSADGTSEFIESKKSLPAPVKP